VIQYLEEGRFPIDEVISKTLSIDGAGQALAEWAEDPKGIIKIMVNFNHTES
jgi:threonine dehydrogenase-like Zn-dependent dehydrogenase